MKKLHSPGNRKPDKLLICSNDRSNAQKLKISFISVTIVNSWFKQVGLF